MEAFESYREALLASEGGVNYLEVVKVHPNYESNAH
jgi:hypothetical protein